MPIPLIVWAGIALIGTVSVSAAKVSGDVADTVREGDELFDSVSRLALIGVTGYIAIKYGPKILKVMKK